MQIDFYEDLIKPDRFTGRGRPRTASAEIKRQAAAAARARREKIKAVPPTALKARDKVMAHKRYEKRKRRLGPEFFNAYQKDNYRKNRKTILATCAKRYRTSAAGQMLYRAKKRSNQKGWVCDLEPSDIVIPSHCPVLGLPLSIGDRGVAGAIDCSPTLDRVDNSKGYVKGNVRVISWRANKVKNDSTIEELESILAYMRGER